jgi:predicted dinucleotide-binding enzyme
MRIGVLGTGMVGQALAGKLVQLGYEVKMGSREAGNEKAVAWVEAAGGGASQGSFADAAAFGEAVINATGGMVSLAALEMAGTENLARKVLVDVSNPLDFSKGMPPILGVCNDDSVGEQIQRAFPDTRVVKAFNTMNCNVMVDPSLLPGDHTLFVAGDDAGAKDHVRHMAQNFGWAPANIMDLGDITASRALEMYVMFWLRIANATGSWQTTVKVVSP